MQGVAPERTLLLTFTRRAALEMTRRAQRVMAEALAERHANLRVPENLRLPWSGTFHAIGNRLIRTYAQRLGLDPAFSVLDRGDAADLMDVVRHRLGYSKTEKRFPRKDTCLGIYSHRVNTQQPLRHTLETVLSVVPGLGGGAHRRSAAPTSRPSSSSRCSITTTCCSTGT